MKNCCIVGVFILLINGLNAQRTMKNQFITEEGRKAIYSVYEKKLNNLNLEFKEEDVATSFGITHIIKSTNDSKPPLILIHGSNGCAPIALDTYPRLVEKYQVFAVDVLAQPNKSEGTVLNMKSLEYGQWIHEIIEHYALTDVVLVGFSFGGLISLKTLEYSQENIQSAFLTCPAYIVNGNPLKGLFNVFIPMKRYMKTKKEHYFKAFIQAMFTERDEFAQQFLPLVFQHFNMDFSPIPVIKKEAAQQIKTPITLFAADNDLFFPGNKNEETCREDISIAN